MTAPIRMRERHRIHFKVIYDDGASYSAGFVEDASLSGLRLQVGVPIGRGSVVTLEPIDPIEDALFSVRARVVHCEPPDLLGSKLYNVGVEFLGLDEEKKLAVAKMITALEERKTAQEGHWDPFLGVTVPDDPEPAVR